MKKACCILLASVLCLLTLAGCATPEQVPSNDEPKRQLSF